MIELKRLFTSPLTYRIIKAGIFLIPMAFVYTVAVVHLIPNYPWWYLAPAGIVANFFLPFWVFLTFGNIIYRDGTSPKRSSPRFRT